MSAGTSLRSFGRPYFTLEQADLNNMVLEYLPKECFGGFKVQFKLHELPVQYASASECHALASFVQFQNGIDLLQFGITPNGALRVEGYGGAYAMTYPAAVLPDNQWHEAIGMLYPEHADPEDSGSSIIGYVARIVLDGTDLGFASSDLSGGLVALQMSGATSLGSFLIFNNAHGMSRTDVSIRDVVSYEAFIPEQAVQWAFSEGFGTAVGGEYPFPSKFWTRGMQSYEMQAKFRMPYFNDMLWGALPDDLNGAYSWRLNNQYYEIDRPRTNYLDAGGTV